MDNDLSSLPFVKLGFKDAGKPEIWWASVGEGSYVNPDLTYLYNVMYTHPESYWYEIPTLLIRSETADGVLELVSFILTENPYDQWVQDIHLALDSLGNSSLSLESYLQDADGTGENGTKSPNQYNIRVENLPNFDEYKFLKINFALHETSFMRFRL